MNPLAQVVEVKNSPLKLVGFAVGGVLLTAMCAAVVFGPMSAPGGSLPQFAGWVGIPFFGAMTLIAIGRLVSPGKTVVTLSPAGYLDTRLSERPVPWSDIKGVNVWTMQRQKVIVLQVPTETEASIGMTRMARWSRTANAKLGADGLCTMASGLTMSHDDLLAAITERAKAAQAQ